MTGNAEIAPGLKEAADWHRETADQLDGSPRREDEHPTDFAMRRVKAEWHREAAASLEAMAERPKAPDS